MFDDMCRATYSHQIYASGDLVMAKTHIFHVNAHHDYQSLSTTKNSKKHLESSWTFPGNVLDISWKFLGHVPVAFRKFPGNVPNIGQKSFQKHPQNIPNHPKNIPKSSKNHLKIIPKSSQKTS